MGGRGSWRPHVPLSVPRRGEGPRPRCDGDGQARPPALAADRPCPPPPQIWWLDPELTYGNAKPFVFTQGHSVCNRSFFPCFDTPAVKCTYSAVVKVSVRRAGLPPPKGAPCRAGAGGGLPGMWLPGPGRGAPFRGAAVWSCHGRQGSPRQQAGISRHGRGVP